jgi:DNA polymerase I
VFGYHRVWCVDTEFGTSPAGRPLPVCLVAIEFYTRQEVVLWEDELATLDRLPFDTENDLFVCFSIGAEVGVLLELGLAVPRHICDLFVEFRAIRNGYRKDKDRDRLIDALAFYALMAVAAEEKESMRALAMRGGPWTPEERAALIAYCREDVVALLALLPAMAPGLTRFHPREITFRGRSMVAVTRSTRTGIPLDTPHVHAIAEHREAIQLRLAAAGEAAHGWGVYNAAGELNMARLSDWLADQKIPLPRTATGLPTLKDKVWRQWTPRFPQLGPLRQCSADIDAFTSYNLTVDTDGRSRPWANPYRAKTGRNQPSSTAFPFAMQKCFRHLIKPEEGWGVAYLDARAQEFLIAAVLSGDKRMLADYFTGDVHLQMALNLGLPPSARQTGKAVNFGINYGQGPWGLAQRLGYADVAPARMILAEHRRIYPQFHHWQQSVLNGLRRPGREFYYTQLGWSLGLGAVHGRSGDRSMRNFPIQASANDWLRVVMIAATEARLEVCASVHDGFLIAAPLGQLDEDIARMAIIMRAASIALYGVPMFIDCDPTSPSAVVRWPTRFIPDETAARETWAVVVRELRAVGAWQGENETEHVAA